jgi:molybdopterin/thiamine biosynthesis adenylyltransferase
VVDDGSVEEPDVRRQPLHFTPDLGVPKAQNAAVKLRALNPDVQVDPYPARLDEQNGEAIVMGADLVVDCTGGPGHAVNDACCAARVPLVTGGVSGLTGFALTVLPGETACLRCASPAEASAGAPALFGALAGLVGSIQALEALRMLSGLGSALAGTLLEIDGATMEQTRVATSRLPGCNSCEAVPAAAQSA